jgi:hypothetical protein
MPDLKRRRGRVTAGIGAAIFLGGAILLAAVAHRLASELICAPRFASPDAGEVVRAYFTARQWGYRGTSERALAPEVRENLHAPNVMHPFIDDAFLASNLTVSAPQETLLYGEYDEELLFKELRLDAAKDCAILMSRGFR